MTTQEIAENKEIANKLLNPTNSTLEAPVGYEEIFNENALLDKLELTLQDNEFYLFTRDMPTVLNSLLITLFAPEQKKFQQDKLANKNLSKQDTKFIKNELNNITDREQKAYESLQRALFLDPKLDFTLNNAGFWFDSEMCVKHGSCNSFNDKRDSYMVAWQLIYQQFLTWIPENSPETEDEDSAFIERFNLDLFPLGFDKVPGNREGDKRPEKEGRYAWRPCNSDPEFGNGFTKQQCTRPFYPSNKFMRTNIELLDLAFKGDNHFFSSLVPKPKEKAYWKSITRKELKNETYVYFLPNVAQQSAAILLFITKN